MEDQVKTYQERVAKAEGISIVKKSGGWDTLEGILNDLINYYASEALSDKSVKDREYYLSSVGGLNAIKRIKDTIVSIETQGEQASKSLDQIYENNPNAGATDGK